MGVSWPTAFGSYALSAVRLQTLQEKKSKESEARSGRDTTTKSAQQISMKPWPLVAQRKGRQVLPQPTGMLMTHAITWHRPCDATACMAVETGQD